uniref:NlpC/P60 family protein n=1 Tax=Candidatus Fimivicinus sp. TaxID=3056640 RepID=UPI003FEE798A
MASKTNTGLVAYAKAQVGNPYWYGTFGQVATEALLKSKMAQYPGQFEGSRPATARAKHIGKRVHDCCGLIKGYLWCSTPTSAPKYVAAQDVNVGGLKQRCKTKGGIKTIPDIIGLLLFRGTSHVGIYIGDGWVIEAKGFDHGVVRSRLEDGNWDTWGKLDWITYEAAKPVQPDKPVTSSIVKGSRVKVRDGAKTYDGKGVASFVYGNTYTVDE